MKRERMEPTTVHNDGEVKPYTWLDRLWGRARRWLNIWRLRTYEEDGMLIEFYTRRKGILVTRIENLED